MKVWQKELQSYPIAAGNFPLTPRSTALLIVDMQYYDTSPDYGIGVTLKKGYPEIFNYYNGRLNNLVIPNCLKLLQFFRQNKMRIFQVAFGASMPDGSDMLPLRKLTMKTVPAFTTNDFEYQILEELKPLPGELVVSKATRSGFVGTSLDHKLRMIGIESVVIAGAVTNGCVESTARVSADFGYKTILVDDACATWSQKDHDATMKAFAMFFGKVADTDELLRGLKEAM